MSGFVGGRGAADLALHEGADGARREVQVFVHVRPHVEQDDRKLLHLFLCGRWTRVVGGMIGQP